MKMLLVLCLLALAANAYAGEARSYDAKGNYTGRATQNKANLDQWSTYSPGGKYTGRVMLDKDNPGESRVYDNRGNYLGRAREQKDVRK